MRTDENSFSILGPLKIYPRSDTDKKPIVPFDIDLSNSCIIWNELKSVTLVDDPDKSLPWYQPQIISFRDCSSYTFTIRLKPTKMSRKRFKKWAMSKGMCRDAADLLCQAVKWAGRGRISYLGIYRISLFYPEVQFCDLWREIFERVGIS